jgi:UDP-N-acetylglucosamine--N-acetylmuramyl-(pentapeptide) pyrophosphoryl-undecaprenol N-acetylglucosamine transferase
MIAEIELLYNSPEKAEAMSECAKKLCVTDTNDRIMAVIDKLYEKRKNTRK